MSIGSSPILSFVGHTDVVPESDNWNYTPFDLTIEKDILIGHGVADMKGRISAFLYTLNNINLNKLKNGISVYFTYDEEIGFNGTKVHLVVLF